MYPFDRALSEDCKPSQGHLSMLASQCLSFNDAELREVREGPDLREDQWMVVSGGHFERWGIGVAYLDPPEGKD